MIFMKTIVCYGDSNTFGTNPAFTGEINSPFRWGKEVRWTGKLQKLLGEEYNVIEEGLGGRTTAWEDQATAGRNGLAGIFPVLQTHEPIDLVIIMLGTNDLKEVYGASPMEIGRGLESLIRICLNPYSYTDGHLPQLLVVSPILLGEDIDNSWLSGVFGPTARERCKKLASEFEKIARKYGCLFLDAAKVAKASEKDSMHMEAEEHTKLANAMYEMIQGKI